MGDAGNCLHDNAVMGKVMKNTCLENIMTDSPRIMQRMVWGGFENVVLS